MSETKCTDCGSRNLSVDDVRGERVCDDCGLVIEETIADLGAEWRVYADGNDSGIRGGEKLTNLLHDKGLSTTIDWQNRDYKLGSPSPPIVANYTACGSGKDRREYPIHGNAISQ